MMPTSPTELAELTKLYDIHLPNALSWWPLAPGWYALILLLCLAAFSSILLIRHHHRKTEATRQALRELATCETQQQQNPNSQRSAAKISELLKRVALAYYPREQVASLQGQAWLTFLNHTAAHIDFNEVRKELLACPYQPPTDRDLTLLFKLSKHWIAHQTKRGSHV